MLPRPLLACLALASSACSDDAAGRADTTAAPDATAGDLDDDAPTGPPVPGGDIGWSAPSAGFATTRPDWAEAGTCASGQWWQYSGDHESTHMHPGRACIECHTRESAPAFRFAGTVFADVADTDECRGVAGVDVTILSADGAVVATTTTGLGGNFYFPRAQVASLPSFRARLTFEGRAREMTNLVSGSKGDCNSCHTTRGENDAPGRIVAP